MAVAVAVLTILSFALPAGAIAPTASSDGAGSVTATETPVTLTVQLQAPDGSAIGGANVTVSYDDTSQTTTSFSNGNALVDVPEDAVVTIHVDHPEYIVNHNVTHDVAQAETVGITMYRRGISVVEVRNAEEDSPNKIQNALVEFTKVGSDRNAASGYTGSNGIYQTPDVESGEYEVVVRKRGFLVRETTINITPQNPGTVIELTEATVDVAVTVQDDHFSNPQPVQGATVAIRYQGQSLLTGQTGDSGRRTLPVGVNGQYTLRVTKDGYQTVERTFSLGEEGTSYSLSMNRNRSLSVEVVSDRVIAGESSLIRVENAYGDRVEDALIRRNGTDVGRTDANGELQVDIPEAGTFAFVAVDGDVRSEPVTVTGYDPSTATATATATPTATPTETETTASESGPLPGFTPLVGLLGILGAIAIVALRRRR